MIWLLPHFTSVESVKQKVVTIQARTLIEYKTILSLRGTFITFLLSEESWEIFMKWNEILGTEYSMFIASALFTFACYLIKDVILTWPKVKPMNRRDNKIDEYVFIFMLSVSIRRFSRRVAALHFWARPLYYAFWAGWNVQRSHGQNFFLSPLLF